MSETPSFARLPATLERLLTGETGGEPLELPLLQERFGRVVFVYLDGFGWTFLERQGRHPLLERARAEGFVELLRTQWPSTTTAHVTTIHSGLPVEEHGLYEWHVLEPSLDRLITPLLFSFAGDGGRNTLVGTLEPADVFPAESLHVRLAGAGVRSSVVLPAAIAQSPPSRMLLRGASVVPYRREAQGLAAAARALAASERAHAHVYIESVDGLMHDVGPDHADVDGAFAAALDAVAAAPWPVGALVLLTADHGMAPVDPDRTAYVNLVWPELADHLRTGADGKPLAPAGSCRDLFLHVLDGHVEAVVAGLGERLDGVAEVVEVAELVERGAIGPPSARLRERLAEVVVLPRYGEAAFWWEAGRFEQDLRGQHGGLTPQEARIPLVAWVT